MSITIQPAPAGKLALACKRCSRRFEMEPRRVYRWLTIHLRGCTPPTSRTPPAQAGTYRIWTSDEDDVLLASPNLHVAAAKLNRTVASCRYRHNHLTRKTESA